MNETMEIRRDDLLRVLAKRYPDAGQIWYERCTDWLMHVEDSRLTPTIQEIAKDEPISEIPFSGPDGKYYSAVLIMQRRNNNDIIGALQWMVRFFQNPQEAIYTIDQSFR